MVIIANPSLLLTPCQFPRAPPFWFAFGDFDILG